MKKLSTLCAGLLIASASFAAVEYDLQGAVTNDQGWMSKADIAYALQQDYNQTYGTTKDWVKLENGVYYYNQGKDASENVIWKTVADAQGADCTIGGFLQNQTYNTSDNLKKLVESTTDTKYNWLKDYILANRQTNQLTGDLSEALYRKELSAFFLCSPKNTSWPSSSSYETTGGYDAFAAIWKHGFDNPTEVAEGETWTLNAPYKEGETFRGWFDNAAGSGTPVTTIDHNTTGKLYACFGEYIPNVAEVLAMQDETETKMAATVTYVAGSNFWVQDATGGILCYGKDNGLTEGDVVVLNGTKTTYSGSPELNNAVVVSKSVGTPYPATEVILATLKADYTPYLNKLVKISAVQISRYETVNNYVNTYISDGTNEFLLYKYDLKETDYPVGTILSLQCVVSFYQKDNESTGTIQLRGKTEWIEVAAAADKDNYNYPARGENGEYTLECNWLYSANLDNFNDNRPNADAGEVRGMIAKDGKMYFINRAQKQLIVVDGATGKRLESVAIKGEHLFQKEILNKETGLTEWTDATTLPYNDIKMDNAGNVLMGCCITNGQTFFIYKIDLATGEATELINERLWDNTELEFEKIDLRFDAFGVYGDVDSKAVIMAQDANSMLAFRWDIEGGVAGKAQKVTMKINPDTDKSYLIQTDGDKRKVIANPGTAPQIFPVDFNYYYLDGNATLPTLFSVKKDVFGYSATLMDDFINCPTGIQLGNNEGDTCKLNQGHNGLLEFQVGDEYFLVMAATNTAGVPKSAFALYKFADAAKSFAEMEPLWFFPNAGMGDGVNGYRTAVPSVEVKDNVATIYLYTGEVGYGVYTFTGKVGTALDNVKVESDNVRKIFENGQIYILKNGVKYTVLGNVVE